MITNTKVIATTDKFIFEEAPSTHSPYALCTHSGHFIPGTLTGAHGTFIVKNGSTIVGYAGYVDSIYELTALRSKKTPGITYYQSGVKTFSVFDEQKGELKFIGYKIPRHFKETELVYVIYEKYECKNGILDSRLVPKGKIAGFVPASKAVFLRKELPELPEPELYKDILYKGVATYQEPKRSIFGKFVDGCGKVLWVVLDFFL